MGRIRPRHLALGFAAYFGIVAYLAWSAASPSKGPWFNPATSQIVYQTAMVGGIMVLASLFITASIAARLLRSGPSGSASNPHSRGSHPRSRAAAALLERPAREVRATEANWSAGEGASMDSDDYDSGGEAVRPARETAAVSAALSRLLPSGDSSAETLMDRLSGIRSRSNAVFVAESWESAEVLARLVNEMRPLLVAAKRAGLNFPEVRKLVSEVSAGREGDLSQRVRLIEQVRETIQTAVVERISEELQSVFMDIERTKAASRQVQSAELTAAEAAALLETGNYTAALDRARNARATLEKQVGIAPIRFEWISGASSFGPLAGPSVIAVAYVAIAAMMLPGITGYLETNFVLNTTLILFLSYSWLGLILYALISVYFVLRPSTMRVASQD